jgi:hypothetical protein
VWWLATITILNQKQNVFKLTNCNYTNNNLSTKTTLLWSLRYFIITPRHLQYKPVHGCNSILFCTCRLPWTSSVLRTCTSLEVSTSPSRSNFATLLTSPTYSSCTSMPRQQTLRHYISSARYTLMPTHKHCWKKMRSSRCRQNASSPFSKETPSS